MNEKELFVKMKEIENEYLKPHSFYKFNNYWLPWEVVKESKNDYDLEVVCMKALTNCNERGVNIPK